MYLTLQLFAVLSFYTNYSTAVSFDEALAKKQITASATANKGSSHYQQPVLLSVKNITATEITVELPVGRYFHSEDSTEQNFVSTEPLMVTLAPGQTSAVPVSAMCVNHHKSAPEVGDVYTIKKSAPDKLLKTAQFVNQNKLYGSYLGQTMMWCISDNEPLEEVFSYNDTHVNDALKFLSTLTGKPVPPPPAADDYSRNAHAKPKITVGGNFNYRFSSPKAVHVAMFDAQNIAVRELYNNPSEPAGEHKISFEFDGSVYNNGTYYVRFLCDNRIIMEHQMDL